MLNAPKLKPIIMLNLPSRRSKRPANLPAASTIKRLISKLVRIFTQLRNPRIPKKYNQKFDHLKKRQMRLSDAQNVNKNSSEKQIQIMLGISALFVEPDSIKSRQNKLKKDAKFVKRH